MSNLLLLKNARIINEGNDFKGHILIRPPYIEKIFSQYDFLSESLESDTRVIDLSDKIIIPGVIDSHVHFREPGLTHKGDIFTESKAAVAGGITSYMEMPNTQPQTISQLHLEEKLKIASEKSFANYSFYLGATNENINELIECDKSIVGGIKLFMGSSTGNMLVDSPESLKKLFSEVKHIPIAVHCEDEKIIKENTEIAISEYGEAIPMIMHPAIRSHEACYVSSKKAIELARKYDTRLHLLHLSTTAETGLLHDSPLSSGKMITAEVCVHHLWFTKDNYKNKGSLIKWNPAIKDISDKNALWEALLDNRIDVIATDHAPHTYEEKQNSYLKCPSGAPMVQHSLPLMIDNYRHDKISLDRIVEKMCHNPAHIFNIKNRGFIRPQYFADLVVIDLNKEWQVDKTNILYKCGWSPLEKHLMSSSVIYTFVNGNLVYNNGVFSEDYKGSVLEFNR